MGNAININPQQAATMRPTGEVKGKNIGERAQIFNEIVANEYALFTKTLNYHWNVTGPRFHSLHIFLEEQYHALLKIVDSVAERVRILGEHPLSTVHEMEGKMTLQERPAKFPDDREMLADLLGGHLTLQKQIREALAREDLFAEDPGSDDFLTGLLQEHEKMSWMLKSHIE